MEAARTGPLGYSDLPDLLRGFLRSIADRTVFSDIHKNKDVLFFLDEPDFRLKLTSVIGWSNTLTAVDLRSIGMTAQDARELRLGLSESKTIDTIRAGYQRSLGDAGAVEFAKLLQVSSSLTILELPRTNIGTEGAIALGEALKVNRSLVRLDLSSNLLRVDAFEPLLKPLTASDHLLPENTSLQILLIGGGSNRLCKKGAKAVSRMLRTNQALTELSVNLNPLSDSGIYTLTYPLTTARTDNSVQHQANKALRQLTIGFARKAEGGNGAHGIIKMVENNYRLRVLSLINFEHSWEFEDIKKLFLALKGNDHLQELRLGACLEAVEIFDSMTKQERFPRSWTIKSSLPFIIENPHPSPRPGVSSLIRNTQLCKPKFARILLCGHPDSGKDGLMNLLKSKYFVRKMGSDDIHVLEESDEIKISIWNFPHHEMYNCFQSELLLPNLAGSEEGATSFIVVCNSLQTHGKAGAEDMWKSDVELKEEITYWLRFVASSITTPMRLAPLIWIAFSPPLKGQLERVVEDGINNLASKYEEVLTVDRKPFYFDNSKKAVTEIKEKLVGKLKENVQLELSNSSSASLNAVESLKKLKNVKDKDWLLTEAEVSSIWQNGNDLQFYEVAHALHDAGELILFKEFEQNKVVVKPDRLISEIIPKLLDISSRELARDLNISEGLVPELSLQKYLSTKKLSKLDGPLIALLMRWLKLCYKSKRAYSSGDCLFIPGAITHTDNESDASHRGTLQLEWSKSRSGVYVGRRYLSRDKLQTFMTQSLFHQLQLELLRDGELMTNRHHPETKVTLQRNIIRIVTDEMEILVEFGGFVGYFIDVMVSSKAPYTQTVAFIHKYVRNPITRLSRSTKGLEEGLIRPFCVTMLTPCKYRQSQVVMMKHLRAHLRDSSCPLNHKHPWDEVVDEKDTTILKAGSDLVIGYLDRKDLLDIFKRKNISAVPPKNLSDLLTSVPCRFRAAESAIGLYETSLHKLFVRHMIESNREVQKMLFSGVMPIFSDTGSSRKQSHTLQMAETESDTASLGARSL